MDPFWLALISALAHALWNALAKFPGRERAATLCALCLAFVAAALWWFIRPEGGVQGSHTPWILLAGLGEAAYVYSLGIAYSRGDLALTYSVSRALALVFIWPLSFIAFGSLPPLLALIATLFVGGGILLARKASASTSEPKWHLGWTFATGASVALYHTGYKGAVGNGAAPALAFLAAIAIALPVLFALVGRDVRTAVPSLFFERRILLAGVLCGASFLCMLEALRTAESGRVLGIRNASVGFAVLIAFALGERPSRREWFGLLTILIGVTLFGLQDPAGR